MLKQEVQEILDTLKDNLMNKLDRLHHIQDLIDNVPFLELERDESLLKNG